MPDNPRGEAPKNAGPASDRPNPIIMDLGSKKRKSVKQLLNGKGKLFSEAMDSIQELQRVGTIPQSAQPVIVVVRQKSRPSMFPMMRGFMK